MKVYSDVDFYTKTRNHRKTLQKSSEKRKKQQPTENQKNTEYRNTNWARFLHLACQGEVRTLAPSSVTPLL